ncbi:hypothetical protein ACIPEQ_15100 [Curtobacterium sp. NPDC087080]|uniref:hypothetical protein n=1 Tax=Curtobacterium sp. NPDC087080 TaxID=3363965 RepID=UPI0037FAE07E
MQKTARLAATTGVALALGASLLAATPAVAAPQQGTAPTVASASAQAEATGPTITYRNVKITTSVIQGDEVLVRGVVTQKNKPNAVQAAAGKGYQTQAPVAANGSFEIRFPVERATTDAQDYGLRFGKVFFGSFMPMADLWTPFYATRA